MTKYIFLVISAICFLNSCSQEAAKVVYRGHNYYGKNVKENSIYEKSNISQNYQQNSPTNVENIITVKTGASLYSISKQNKIPLRNLIEANKLEPPYKLYPGDKIKIPSMRNTHIVKYAENISIIAYNYGVSSNDIISLNSLKKPYVIKPGQILALPYNILKEDKKAPSKANSVLASITNSVKSKNNKTDFIYPVNGKILSTFGTKKNGSKNDGINIAAKKGTPIKSVSDGNIVYVGNALKGYGNLVIIKHQNNWLSAYAHNDEVYVTKNQQIKQGDIIATVGSSGDAEKSQLYFSLRKGRQAVNPKEYLSNI